jgi:hypothetical protein
MVDKPALTVLCQTLAWPRSVKFHKPQIERSASQMADTHSSCTLEANLQSSEKKIEIDIMTITETITVT